MAPFLVTPLRTLLVALAAVTLTASVVPCRIATPLKLHWLMVEFGRGDDKNGATRTRSDLDRILESHRRWASGEANGERAQLERADLTGADLRGASLSHVDLTTQGGAIWGRMSWGQAGWGEAPPNEEALDRALRLEGRAAVATLSQSQFLISSGQSMIGEMRSSFLEDAGVRGLGKNPLLGADLTGAVLHSAKLQGANLAGVELNSSDLSRADLTNCVLSNANLQEAEISNASLRSTDLRLANFRGANLTGADLEKALLVGADLSGANLQNSSLRLADLRLARLGDLNAVGADLYGVNFEPLNPPPTAQMAYAKNLHHMIWTSDPGQLAELKTKFRELGFRNADRQIIAAMFRKDATPWEALPFGYTSDFGASPTRALWLGVLLWLICTVAYLAFMHGSGPSGIYFVATRNNGRQKMHRVHLRTDQKPQASFWRNAVTWLRREWRLLRAAMLFSMMSAFNIGFRDINFGRWIRLLLIKNYDLKAAGKARPVAGWQALLSVGLLASFVVTYWGRPFEN